MEVWFVEQWKTIVESCIMGLIFGAGYDIIRVLQVLCGIRSGKREKAHSQLSPKQSAFWLYGVSDFAFMLLVTVATSIFLGEVNHGMLRWYLVLPCAGGLWLYHNTIGRLTMAVSETIAMGIRWVVKQLCIRPIRWLLHNLWGGIKTVVCGVAYFVKRQFCHIRMRHIMRHFPELVKL